MHIQTNSARQLILFNLSCFMIASYTRHSLPTDWCVTAALKLAHSSLDKTSHTGQSKCMNKMQEICLDFKDTRHLQIPSLQPLDCIYLSQWCLFVPTCSQRTHRGKPISFSWNCVDNSAERTLILNSPSVSDVGVLPYGLFPISHSFACVRPWLMFT